MAESNGNIAEETENVAVVETRGNDTELTELDKSIIRQIEYYFGDMNLHRDKFLQEQVKLDDGWIPLDMMLKFKRLAQLSTDPEVIIKSLLKSTSNLMEISDDKKKIRRSPNVPLPINNEERRKEVMSRTIYVKGFPITEFTLDNALTFFSTYGSIESIILRNKKDKITNQFNFKGSVFAIFKTIDDAKTFVELESVKYEETELIKKWQSDYLEEKRVIRDERKVASKLERQKPGAVEETKDTLTKGAVLHLTGISGDITREDIRKDLQSLGATVLFVDFNRGDPEGWVRLDKENAAKEVLEKMEGGKFNISDVELNVEVLEGKVEEDYLAKTLEEKKNRRAFVKGGRGRGGHRGRGGFRGGRGGNRGNKRKGSPSRGGSEAKKQTV